LEIQSVTWGCRALLPKTLNLKQALPLVDHDVIWPRYANVLLACGKDYSSHWTQWNSTEVSIVKSTSQAPACHFTDTKAHTKSTLNYNPKIYLTNFRYILIINFD
jgi:hypothetical protein